LYNPDHRFQPHVDRSPEWNRGAYLVEALEHCGECHTPRNLLQALDNHQKFAGAVVDGWHAYNITSDQTSGIGAWSAAELGQYLSNGHASGRGTASGPMAEAVDLSLKTLTTVDMAAIVTYLQSVPAVATPDLPAPKATPAPADPKLGALGGSSLAGGDADRRTGGERSQRDQCGADDPLGQSAPNAARAAGRHARVRQCLFQCRNRRRRQLCRCPVRRKAVRDNRGGCRQTSPDAVRMDAEITAPIRQA